MEIDMKYVLNLLFQPMTIAALNFSVFAIWLAYSLLTGNSFLIAASFAFFLSGTLITILAITSQWVKHNGMEAQTQAPAPAQTPPQLPQPTSTSPAFNPAMPAPAAPQEKKPELKVSYAVET